jgi:hypothetical protein
VSILNAVFVNDVIAEGGGPFQGPSVVLERE